MQGAGKHAYRDWTAFVEDAIEARKRQALDLTADVSRARDGAADSAGRARISAARPDGDASAGCAPISRGVTRA